MINNTFGRRAFVKGAALFGGACALVPLAAFADDKAAEDAGAEAEEVTLQIFAANSLEKALPKVQELFSEQYPNVKFADTQFKASGDLVEQMIAGAQVDVLITASKGTMDKAEEAKLILPETRVTMFNNDLVIVRAQGSDIEITGIADVAGDGIEQIAIGDAATVPAGKYANQALYSVGLYTGEAGDDGEYAPEIADRINLVDKVGTAASYVSTGDCQVGFVYSSDVYRYEGIEVAFTCPEESHKKIVYPGAVAATAQNVEIAQAFLDFCLEDPDAFEVWAQFGFEVAEDEAVPAAAAAGAFKDGVYEASAKGIGGDVPLTVTIEGGKIVSVEVGENGETQGIGSKAIEQLPALIVEAQGIEGVEGVSGASVTSKAIFTAMADILEQAKA